MVDFSLTQKQVEMQELAREFGEKHIKPVAMEIDKIPDPEKAFPVSLFEKGFEIGFQKACIPEKYGGLGLDCLTHVLVWEELAAADIGYAISLQAHNLAVAHMLNLGTEEQRETFSKPIVEGGLAVISAVEANAGAAVAVLDPLNFVWETTAVKNGDDWVLNGQKTYCSNAGTPLTRWICFLVRTNMEQTGISAHSAFLVWPDTPGLTIGKNYDKMGHRMAYTPSIELKDVRVPNSQLVGETAGFPLDPPARTTTADNFLNVAAMAMGLARTIYDECVAFAKTRVTNGKPMIQHQVVATKLANMFIEMEAARAMLWKAAWISDTQPQTDQKMVVATKVMCSDMVARISREGLQIFGGHGYTKDTLIEKLYRDAKAPEIYEGANDSLRVALGQFIEWGI
ncbi:MAG: acyl-CoA dehydrogenase family protein [Deltaproteobacteria bacterium]|nr:acyl-CoA dehydrogenase family protein [Deltaproteobacteria bacterium]